MQVWNHYIAGVEDIWCVLVASVFLCELLTWRLLRNVPLYRIGRIHREQSGATYMLPLVLTMPFYVLLITMIVECTLMLTAKIGSVGAAYSAARAAAVWLPYESAMPKTAPDYTPIEDRELMVRLAAARSMWPYASGSKSHSSDEPLGEFVDQTIAQQIEAFQRYSGNEKFDVEYLKRKFTYAFSASAVSIDYFNPITGDVVKKPAFNAKLQLTLHYESPIHTFGIGKLFGEKSQVGKYFVRPIITTVLIENEGVKPSVAGNKLSPDKLSKSLGIRYYNADISFPLRMKPYIPSSVLLTTNIEQAQVQPDAATDLPASSETFSYLYDRVSDWWDRYSAQQERTDIKKIESRFNATVIGPKNPDFHCNHHALGIEIPTTGLVGGFSAADVNAAIQREGWQRAELSGIDLNSPPPSGVTRVVVYANQNGVVSHFALQKPDGTFESKLGRGYLISHGSAGDVSGYTNGFPVFVIDRPASKN